jgi:hypothetical protein
MATIVIRLCVFSEVQVPTPWWPWEQLCVFCLLCEVCTAGEETVVITEAGCVYYDMRTEAEEIVEH